MDQGMLIQMFTLALAVAMLVVVVSDATRYKIPNWLNGALLLLYVAAAAMLPSEPLWSLAAAAIVLAVGLGSFALGFMGGGDAKLLFVLTLWTGWSMVTLQFLFMTAVFGGILVVAVLLLRNIVAAIWLQKDPERKIPRFLKRKEPVPYGLAIASAFLWVLLTGQVAILSAVSA